MKKIKPLILSGGSGKRLWPLSTPLNPKQFINIAGQSLIERTINHLKKHSLFGEITVAGNAIHKNHFGKYIHDIDNLILESESSGTAASIYTALKFGGFEKNDFVIILPSDHILDYGILVSSISKIPEYILDENIVCFGLNPHFPSTEYGYIKTSNIKGFLLDVSQFCEKPNIENATRYINTPCYFWNSGILFSKVDVLLNEYSKYYESHYLFNDTLVAKDELSINLHYNFNYLNTSIDYAILEKSKILKMIEINDKSWTDLGSHASLANFFNKNRDSNNNLVIGDNVLLSSVKNSIILNLSNDKTAIIGVNDTTVVISSNGNLMMKNGLDNHLSKLNFIYEENIRPWGYYNIIFESENIKIKIINLNPNSSISLQKHNFRSEHWLVIDGQASILNGDNNFLLSKGESTFIPKNTLHRLSNKQGKDLLILEVQFGDYLGEDDIVRFDDLYGRQ